MPHRAHGEVIAERTMDRSELDVSMRYEDMRSLAAGAVRAVPALRGATVGRAWAEVRPGTPDELPILGPACRVLNLLRATGGFRAGIVAAPLAGEVAAATVVGELPSVAVEPFLAERSRAVAV